MFAAHLAGGTHHAFYDYGEGFCIFSDIAVACNIALNENSHSISKIMIIDLDVHQGNGNAVLFLNNDKVFTFSMHCRENYFSKKQISDFDIELPAKCGDEEYLNELQRTLPRLLEEVQPQLVFYQAGVDIFVHDKLGKMSISRQGLLERNTIVYNNLLRRGIRCVTTMGGGYLNPLSESFQTLIDCHADVYRQCIDSLVEYNIR
jgi:acetoin utilization deacetylase AcuC-like enzyme